MTPRVLVVEDEYLIAAGLEAELQALGCKVIGPVGGLTAALEIVRDRPIDAATVDLKLRHGETAEPLIEELRKRGIPYAVTAGGSGRERHKDALCTIIGKPYSRSDLERWVLWLARQP
jgi:DNA-binding response OmpR family regulator